MVSTERMQEFGWCCMAMGQGAASSACSSSSYAHAGSQVKPSGCRWACSAAWK